MYQAKAYSVTSSTAPFTSATIQRRYYSRKGSNYVSCSIVN